MTQYALYDWDFCSLCFVTAGKIGKDQLVWDMHGNPIVGYTHRCVFCMAEVRNPEHRDEIQKMKLRHIEEYQKAK